MGFYITPPHRLTLSSGILQLLGKLPFATTGFYITPPHRLTLSSGIIQLLGKLPFATTGFYITPPHRLTLSSGIIQLLGKLPFATTGFYITPPHLLIGNYPVTWQIAICHYGVLHHTASPSHHLLTTSPSPHPLITLKKTLSTAHFPCESLLLIHCFYLDNSNLNPSNSLGFSGTSIAKSYSFRVVILPAFDNQ